MTSKASDNAKTSEHKRESNFKKKNEIAFLFSEAWRETSYHKNKENRSGGKPVPGRSVLLINIYWFCDQTEFRL